MTAPPTKIPFARAKRAHAQKLAAEDVIAKRRAEREAKRKFEAVRAESERREADRKARLADARKVQRMKEFAERRARELQPPVPDRWPKIKNDGVGGHAPFIARETFRGLHREKQRQLIAASMYGTAMADVERARRLLATDADLLSAHVRAEIRARSNFNDD